jgi:hypothetical protein
MLHTMTICGGPQVGKTTAALAYARSATKTGLMALVISASFEASKELARHVGAWPVEDAERLVFSGAGRCMHIKGAYRTIVVNDWDRLSKAAQDDVAAYAERCALVHGKAWLVKVQGEAAAAPAASLDGLFAAFTNALQARLVAALAIPLGLLPAR